MEDKETKKCCDNCKNTILGRHCEILKQQNEEYRKLCEDPTVGKIWSNDSAYAKMKEIEKESICPEYKNIYIEFPIVVDDVEIRDIDYTNCLGHTPGCLVRVRPCGEEYKNKTYLGFLIGDLPTSIYYNYNAKEHKVSVGPSLNPGIFIPELQKLVFGYESWWQEIKSPDELKDITDDTINNQWYVRLLKGE